MSSIWDDLKIINVCNIHTSLIKNNYICDQNFDFNIVKLPLCFDSLSREVNFNWARVEGLTQSYFISLILFKN